MSEDKYADNDPERTLVTLEQLSQTIEVMTSVVNRLRQHLSEQLQAKMAEQQPAIDVTADVTAEQEQAAGPAAKQPEVAAPTRQDVVNAQQAPAEKKPESFVVEIRQHEPEPTAKTDKTLH
ncbi:MAG: hypothetical protein PsegKO_18060 [Pseudohongiellaceae bacterium]|jgi:TolA-binding protein